MTAKTPTMTNMEIQKIHAKSASTERPWAA
jgi:hypothetical protein